VLASSQEFPLYKAETKLLSLCSQKYGPLHRDENYRRFLNDWTASTQFLRSGLDSQEFRRRVDNHHSSYAEFLVYFMGAIAMNQGKQRWLEKTPEHVFAMDELSGALPEARFVHIIRDGRDVAISRRKTGWVGTSSKNKVTQLIGAAIEWERAVIAGREAGEMLGERYLEVSYENLVDNTEDVLEVLNSFAGIRLSIESLESSDVGSLRRSNSAFAGRDTGISKSAVRRWRGMLSDSELHAINTVIGKTLESLGYADTNDRLSPRCYDYWRTKAVEVSLRCYLAMKHLIKTRTPLGRLSRSRLP